LSFFLARPLNIFTKNKIEVVMIKNNKKWRTYEEVAIYLLNEFANEFGLEKIEGKQKLKGILSGTEWEIEAKGLVKDEEKFIIVECRRYTTSKLNQESIGALAYRIKDTGAKGGIIVSHLGLQKGAEKIAKAENIVSFIFDKNNTTKDYILKFLEQIKAGIHGELNPTGKVKRRLIKSDGSIIDFED
jgi:hypothetical protein